MLLIHHHILPLMLALKRIKKFINQIKKHQKYFPVMKNVENLSKWFLYIRTARMFFQAVLLPRNHIDFDLVFSL